jgi:hypothetical protein
VGQAIKITVRVADNGTPPMWADYDYFVVVRDSTSGQPADLDWVPVSRDGAFGTSDGAQLEQHLINAKVTDLGPGTETLTVAVVQGPQQAEQFQMNEQGLNGWWTYTPNDFFAGDDPFTFQANDGTKNGNVATIHQYTTYLGVHQVSFGENTSDLLTRDQRHGTGAYLPVDDDDDDYNGTPDANDVKFAKGENDLLQIDLPAPVNVDPGWHYSLQIPTGVRVFTKKDAGLNKSSVEVKGDLPANFSGTLWVEATGTVAGNLRVVWHAKDGSASTDYIVLHSFKMLGPHNVPGTSKYTYEADGGLAGPDSFWLGGGNGGNLIGANTEDPTTHADTAQFKWERGPAIGTAPYQAAPGYTWVMDVNVVRVQLGPDAALKATSQFEATQAPIDDGNHLYSNNVVTDVMSKRIRGVSTDGQPGISWTAPIIMEGPLNGRGIDHIVAGFIQTLVSVTDRGMYDNGSWLVSSFEGQVPMNDSQIPPQVPAATYPWLGLTDGLRTTGVRNPKDPDDNSFADVLLGLDQPRISIPLYWFRGATPAEGDHLLVYIDLNLSFQLDVSAATLDATISNEQVYTRIATADWEFNGTGTVGDAPNFPWTPLSHSQGIVAPPNWTLLSDGSRSPLPPRVANTEIANSRCSP